MHTQRKGKKKKGNDRKSSSDSIPGLEKKRRQQQKLSGGVERGCPGKSSKMRGYSIIVSPFGGE